MNRRWLYRFGIVIMQAVIKLAFPSQNGPFRHKKGTCEIRQVPDLYGLFGGAGGI
ncbi:hypothetical protein ABNP32_22575 [Pseudomonas viridiflava]|uniref:hypothetical protein n=1 Tax=Pseudomonas sp. NPDC096925 TaxID=3364484 RepID=UPI00383A2B10